jgi:glycerol-3-phosphate acyltransferase PlsY
MSTGIIITAFVILPLLGYLLGSIPFGLLIGLGRGIDIRQHGSGNIGATNLGRTLGKKWGYVCFVLDVAKGLLPTVFAGGYIKTVFETNSSQSLGVNGQLAWLSVGTACILGHMFSVYLRFRGGKGVATSLGVVLGVWPYLTFTAVIAMLIWVGVWGITRYVSLASICAAVAFPIGFALLIRQLQNWHFTTLWPVFTFTVLMALLVIVRHRANITRLIAGTENRKDKL